ncbi:MAG TPA: alpha/beta hydrolase [Ktedonobacterales bacterium]|nr:alpha/beta hydrolase [Ktedonobacterales bacterium]
MSPADRIGVTPASALAERQPGNALFVATCRARPWIDDPKESLPLDGGDYQVALAYPNNPNDPFTTTFSYTGVQSPYQTPANAARRLPGETWTTISHRSATTDAAQVLPPGDVLIVVHGFHDSAPEGVGAGEQVESGLDAQLAGIMADPQAAALPDQKRMGGISKAFSAGKPATQSGGVRLAQTLQSQLPRPGTLYQHLIPFTWPAAHSVFPGYLLAKEEVARYAAFSLANLLADLRSTQPDRRILLVAHSMGCFLAIKALNILAVLRSAQPKPGNSPVIIDQMVFYAPDLNADALESARLPGASMSTTSGESLIDQRANGYGYQALDRVGRLTIYYSFHDNVLIWSPFGNLVTEESGGWAGRARLGWCGPYNLAATHENVVAVDCSRCIYDHAAYFTRHEVLEHTARTLAERLSTPPQPACPGEQLATTPRGLQEKAKRLWTWYTPAEIAREQWERFFLYKPLWARWCAVALSLLLPIAVIVGVTFGLVKLIF